MQLIRRLTGSRTSRLGWGIAVLALAAVLALTFVFAWSAVGEEQRGAQARAVGFTTKKPLSALSPSEVAKPIRAGEYAKLIRASKSRILSDDRVTRVRIWNLGGTLVFSTDSVDEISVAKTASQPFKTAASGGVASFTTLSRMPSGGGLVGSSERQYVTFAALRLNHQARPAGVVEIDQRYDAIRAAAYRLWHPMQLVLAVLLLVSLLMLGVSFLAPRSPVNADTSVTTTDPGFTKPAPSKVQKELESRLRALEDSLRDAEARVASTERENRQIAERLVSAHEQLELMTAAAKSGPKSEGSDAGTMRVSALEAALADAAAKAASMESAARQAAEEHEHGTSEVERLRLSMAKQKTEIRRVKEELAARGDDAGANDSTPAVEAATKLADAEEQLRQSSERSMQAEERAAQAEEGRRFAEERMYQAEEGLRRAQEEITRAEQRANEAGKDAERSKGRLGELQARLVQLEGGGKEAERRAIQAEQRLAQLQTVTGQAEERMTQLEVSAGQADERMAQLEASATQAEQRMAQKEVRLREVEAERARLAGELERVLAAADPAEVHPVGDGEGRVDQLAGRIEELETERRRDVLELQRVRKALANTQLELTAATNRAKDAEARIRTLEGSGDGATSELVAQMRGKAGSEPETEQPDESAEPAKLEVSAEGLSLRERLARAAAARYRSTLGSDEGGSR